MPVLAWYHYLDTIWQKTLRHSQFTKSLKTVKRKTTSWKERGSGISKYVIPGNNIGCHISVKSLDVLICQKLVREQKFQSK